MAVVSVTRLHLGSFLWFPIFLLHALAIRAQVRRSAGFVAGWLSNDSEWGFWTLTVWQSAEAMRAFRDSGTHLKAMPKLMRWCDEASYTHWEQADAVPPTAEVAYQRLARDGSLSKVTAPSTRQKAGETVGRTKPAPGQALTPR